MSTKKLKVLVMVDWFAPGFKAGGPIRSCVNFTGNYKDNFELFVLTTDRDLNDTEPYPGIEANNWVVYNGNVKVFYASPDWLSLNAIRKLIKTIQPDTIYLNSMYSRYFSVYPLLLKRSGGIKSKIVVAPRGMLKQSAIQFKAGKKKVFLKLFRMLGMQREIYFHCTDETEMRDVKKFFGDVDATLLPNNYAAQSPLKLAITKQPGEVKMVFLGRVHPIKNLHFLLELLVHVKQHVQLSIVGGLEDKSYWDQCKQLIDTLPSNITVKMLGEQTHEEVEGLLLQHHVMILPTKGENFGHAIFEALAGGRLALISDQTPWRNLSQQKAGWDIPLDKPQQFVEAIEAAAAMDQQTFNEWCRSAWNYCKHYIENSATKEQYLKLFS
jgi:glycosyltransferase involved in cell wall biosynthesis